jgi:biotin carboxyl carrier protein
MTGQSRPRGPVEPAGRQLDPRGVRVSVVGGELDGPAPIVVEPPPVALLPSQPRAAAGLLGGVAEGPTVRLPAALDERPSVDGAPVEARLEAFGPERAVLTVGPDGPRHRLLLLASASTTAIPASGVARREVIIEGWRIEVDLESATRAALRDRARRGREEAGRSGPTQVHAIIPGVVVSVSVASGDEVTAGQQLLVVEAMKMQNELRSPRDGTIERVGVGAGDTIDVGDLLLVLA